MNGYLPVMGQSFRVIDNLGAGPLAGTFLGLGQGALVTANGVPFQVSYFGGTGNDLTLTAVPEPSSLALAGLGFAALCRGVRKRRR